MTKTTRSNSTSSDGNDISQPATLTAILNEIKGANSKLDYLTTDLAATKTSVTAIEARQLNMEQSLKDLQTALQGLNDLDDRLIIVEQGLNVVSNKRKTNYETNRMRIDNF